MSTLVDELLQDFEDSGSEPGDERTEDDFLGAGGGEAPTTGAHADGDMDLDGDGGEEGDEEMGGTDISKQAPEDPEEAKARIEKLQLKDVNDVRNVAGLMKTLEPVLEKIAHFQAQPPETRDASIGNVEDHPEYNLLTESNQLSTSIDSEIVLVHKYIRDHYSIRFPELETLITNPLEYAKVVAILGNGPLDSQNVKTLETSTSNILNATLKEVLDGPSLMIVTLEATRTNGREMSQDELGRVTRACKMVVDLDKAKKTLTEYVQSRMNIFAPNLTALVGSLTAAQMLNAAGGLTGLAKTPSCNISAWGSKKQQSGALATNVTIRQQGFLYHSPIIRGVPSDMKRQALRIVSAKVVLAARVDCAHSSPDGSTGEDFKQNCLERLDKLQEKPLSKGQRALPVPDDKPSRKRGGRRARKAKEATSMTELRKAQNRMAFGKEEKEVGYGAGDSTVGMGMIGQADTGRVRGMQIDARTRAKLSAKNKGWGGLASSVTGGAASSLKSFGQTPGSLDLRGKGLRTSGVGTTLGGGGTMSSLNFTPVQGLELVDPKMQAELKRKREQEQDRWFKGGTFTQVGGSGGSKMSDDGVFKKPQLPPSKRVDTGATKRS
ncbi:U4/U6 small nuclear ribonucleoprotein Prp31 [Cytospora mali]|uniref:U4/U6 small nuclear ribonucleoprotein Prp31 n=1 Tax=Cytospora mali TaxID=578113 RepID=A0A194UR19_CYTMA|nr:U4/U6 small nuclear ribonucleoprotein Prp31 [Valsa mali var. pyri (nom. inval.)]